MSPLPKNIALVTGLAMTLSGAAAQETRPHNVILFVPDGLRALSVTPHERPHHGGDPRPGRELQELPFHVPDLHHRQRGLVRDRPLSGRHRRLQQHHLCRLSGEGRERLGDAVPGSRSGAGRRRPAFRRQLSRRGHHPAGGAASGLQRRRHRQGRPDADFRPHRAHAAKRPSSSTTRPAARPASRSRKP